MPRYTQQRIKLTTKQKFKRGITIANYGVAGTIAGTTAGFYAKGGRFATPGTAEQLVAAGRGAKIGMATGSIYGIRRANRKFGQVPSVEESTGPKQFKNRVGTKTQGRVSKDSRPFNPKVKQEGDAYVSAV